MVVSVRPGFNMKTKIKMEFNEEQTNIIRDCLDFYLKMTYDPEYSSETRNKVKHTFTVFDNLVNLAFTQDLKESSV